MKPLQQLSSALILLLCTFPASLTAEIYTWTDKNGVVHFSDKSRYSEKVTEIKIKENNNIADTVTTDSQWHRDYNKAKQVKAEKANKDAKQRIQNKGYCNQLKSQLANIKQGGRFFVTSPEGKRQFQSEEQMKAKSKRLTKAYKMTCR